MEGQGGGVGCVYFHSYKITTNKLVYLITHTHTHNFGIYIYMDNVTDINKNKDSSEYLPTYQCMCGCIHFFILTVGYVCSKCEQCFTFDEVHGIPDNKN